MENNKKNKILQICAIFIIPLIISGTMYFSEYQKQKSMKILTILDRFDYIEFELDSEGGKITDFKIEIKKQSNQLDHENCKHYSVYIFSQNWNNYDDINHLNWEFDEYLWHLQNLTCFSSFNNNLESLSFQKIFQTIKEPGYNEDLIFMFFMWDGTDWSEETNLLFEIEYKIKFSLFDVILDPFFMIILIFLCVSCFCTFQLFKKYYFEIDKLKSKSVYKRFLEKSEKKFKSLSNESYYGNIKKLWRNEDEKEIFISNMKSIEKMKFLKDYKFIMVSMGAILEYLIIRYCEENSLQSSQYEGRTNKGFACYTQTMIEKNIFDLKTSWGFVQNYFREFRNYVHIQKEIKKEKIDDKWVKSAFPIFKKLFEAFKKN